MLLTMADTSCGGLLAGHSGMSVYGPPGLNTLVNAFRTFVNVRDIGLKVTEFGGSGGEAQRPLVESPLVTITPIVLRAGGDEAAADAATAAAAAEPEAKRQRIEAPAATVAPAGGGGDLDIASVAVEGPAACYVCDLPSVPGKFLPQKVR